MNNPPKMVHRSTEISFSFDSEKFSFTTGFDCKFSINTYGELLCNGLFYLATSLTENTLLKLGTPNEAIYGDKKFVIPCCIGQNNGVAVDYSCGLIILNSTGIWLLPFKSYTFTAGLTYPILLEFGTSIK